MQIKDNDSNHFEIEMLHLVIPWEISYVIYTDVCMEN